MRPEHEEAGVSLVAEALNLLVALERQDLVFARIEDAAVPSESSLNYATFTMSFMSPITGSEVFMPRISIVFFCPSMALGSLFLIWRIDRSDFGSFPISDC